MMFLDIGYPITSRYSVILVSFSRNLNITFSPLVISHCIAMSRHKTISISFLNNNH